MGRIAALMAGGSSLTPLQRRLVGVGRVLAAVAVVLCAVVMALGLARGQSAELMVVTAISLVVAAVPESLPAVVTLALALGARRMTARKALVRRLPAVETLGSVTVLATDKTGTLTEGVMVARGLWTPNGGDAVISGTGYTPEGRVTRGEAVLAADHDPDVADLLTAASLCNDATLRPPADQSSAWTALGDPTEAALLAAAGKFGLDATTVAARFPRIAEVPFDSDRRRMTTVHRRPGGGVRVVCKGAPEAVLRAEILAEPRAVIEQALLRAEDYARDGLRVLVVAHGEQPRAERDESADWDERAESDERDEPAALERGLRLRLLGLVAIVDPPRASAKATIATCQAAGIIPVLITGDHPATAGSIAAAVGILEPGGEVVVRSGIWVRAVNSRWRSAVPYQMSWTG
jgi:Ca2+-transporting ATPase